MPTVLPLPANRIQNFAFYLQESYLIAGLENMDYPEQILLPSYRAVLEKPAQCWNELFLCPSGSTGANANIWD